MPWIALCGAGSLMIVISGEEPGRAAQRDSATRAIDGHRLPTRTAPMASPIPVADSAVEHIVIPRPGQRLEQLFVRAGAAPSDAANAASLLRAASPDIPAGTAVSIFLGDAALRGRPSLERVSIRAGLDLTLTVARGPDGMLTLSRNAIRVTSASRRVRGEVGENLYWSLRASKVEAEPASELVEAIAQHRARALNPNDRFELIFDRKNAADGKSEVGVLQYAALLRATGERTEYVRWILNGRARLIDPSSREAQERGLALPLDGAITSAFGVRIHPIFRTSRFHKGVDIRAPWGAPVHASADGVVTAAGWSGGYGVRVRLAHGDGVATSYSHLSRKAVSPGRVVRKGDLIGYVGSTGFSTGAHLHYEVFRGNRAVDPLGTAISHPAAISRSDRVILAARVAQLRSAPTS